MLTVIDTDILIPIDLSKGAPVFDSASQVVARQSASTGPVEIRQVLPPVGSSAYPPRVWQVTADNVLGKGIQRLTVKFDAAAFQKGLESEVQNYREAALSRVDALRELLRRDQRPCLDDEIAAVREAADGIEGGPHQRLYDALLASNEVLIYVADQADREQAVPPSLFVIRARLGYRAA